MSKEDWLSSYNEEKPFEMTMNPFKIINKDWMLITAGDDTKCNSMTISWGGFGIYMGKPITNIYIRQERYTKEFFDKNEYFTVCSFPEELRDALKYMGNNSGRDGDKYKATGLKPIKLDQTWAIEQATAIYVCRKLSFSDVPVKNIRECEEKTQFFDKNSTTDFHTMYMGEIVKILVKK